MRKLSDRITKDKISKAKKPLAIEYVRIEDIMPNTYNPNTHVPDSFDLLIKSLDYFGFTQPIVVNKPTMEIVDGEHRFRAACVLGYRQVPVCFVEFDDVKLRYATIMHNMARGKNNEELTKKLYEELDKSGVNHEEVLLLNRKKK